MTARFETMSTLNQTCQSCGGTMQIELSETECGLLIDVLGDVCALYKRELGRAARRVDRELWARESRGIYVYRHGVLAELLKRVSSARASARALERAKAKNADPA